MVAHQAIFTISIRPIPAENKPSTTDLTEGLVKQVTSLHNGLKGHTYNLLTAELTLNEEYYLNEKFQRIKNHVFPDCIDYEVNQVKRRLTYSVNSGGEIPFSEVVTVSPHNNFAGRSGLQNMANPLTGRQLPVPKTDKSGRLSASELLTWCVQQHKLILRPHSIMSNPSYLPSQPKKNTRKVGHGMIKDQFIRLFYNCPDFSADNAAAVRTTLTSKQTKINSSVIASIMHQGLYGGFKRTLAGSGTTMRALMSVRKALKLC